MMTRIRIAYLTIAVAASALGIFLGNLLWTAVSK